ncbi:tetratricopeptide repeat protein, partial [Actinoplanes sp. NPDC024001]|uniref:tetratricopeptide repeat protein n=1 Tax=Actinoplanes sp. NPDC024001 TaxID=3154598 RepID=UPI0033CFEF49
RFFPTLSMMLDILPETPGPLILDVRQNGAGPTNLGIRYSDVGRRTDAVTASEEAVGIYRRLSTANPAFLPDLASALTNLGVSYSGSGRRTDAIPPTEEAIAIYRKLSTDNPAFLPNLAGALNNLGVSYSEVGRRIDGITATEEAIGIYRKLSAQNSASLPHLATALTNLGTRYSDFGRLSDAITATEEAIGIYRKLSAQNSAFLSKLAGALHNLERHYMQAGNSAATEVEWHRSLSDAAPEAGAFLLLNRARSAELGETRVISWLTAGLAHSRDIPVLTTALRHQARRHRTHDPDRFDGVWLKQEGELPAWLTVDPKLVETARSWVTTSTYTEEHDHLVRHAALLDSTADAALAEALLDVETSESQRYLDLRDDARVHGVAAAYRPLLVFELAVAFANAEPSAQSTLLAEHRDDLLSDIAWESLARLAEEDDTGIYARADAVLALAHLDQAEPALAALAEPETFPQLLAEIAERPDASALDSTAFLARSVAVSLESTADADFYVAVAAALADDLDDAVQTLTAARRQTPDRTTYWINRLAGIGQVHPEVLRLIATLTAPLDENPEPHVDQPY